MHQVDLEKIETDDNCAFIIDIISFITIVEKITECTSKLASLYDSMTRLCIKVGRGQGDGDIGTRVWGLGTWGREMRDLRTSSMGRGDV